MLVCIPVWITATYRNEYVRNTITAGWLPILSAMAISRWAVRHFDSFAFIAGNAGMPLLIPVFNGIAGSIGSIFTSRISSALHAGSEEEYRKARNVLFVLNCLTQSGFLLVTNLLGLVHVDLPLFALYMTASLALSAIMLILAERMTLEFWRRGYDPDNCVLPLLTALGDVLGTTILVVVFGAHKLIVNPAGGAPARPTLGAHAASAQ
ncbi:MAG: hypothetical protein BJ554DRAFT_6664 [Olpidium bornovanus]|uniref:SLC41A/MgtE integral membrane domain-containing protein n=1 Tax=Olpidium bornovanus TaxID=278681 RepID=A0A8H8DK21_9FUNG|nr:MAG: hypothetical protein BJ554DRAFT_6664 [Olpidium bornovanus]